MNHRIYFGSETCNSNPIPLHMAPKTDYVWYTPLADRAYHFTRLIIAPSVLAIQAFVSSLKFNGEEQFVHEGESLPFMLFYRSSIPVSLVLPTLDIGQICSLSVSNHDNRTFYAQMWLE